MNMNLDDITAVSLAVELEDKTYVVSLPLEHLKLVVQLAASLSDNKTLNLTPIKGKFTTVGELEGHSK